MGRLFISHSTKNLGKVQKFVDFLTLGMGVAADDIFCTSRNGTLPTGENFTEHIRAALTDCCRALCLITPEYLQSKFCMIELGAAWAQAGKILPILAAPITYDDLNGTPLQGLQMLRLEEKEDVMTIYDELRQCQIAKNKTAEFTRHLEQYMSQVDVVPEGLDPSTGTSLVPLRSPTNADAVQPVLPDAQEYYCVTIGKERLVPASYRCYQLLNPLKLKEPLLPDETHWLFYRAGMYKDPREGDTVRILVSSTSGLRDFPDLKNARNIYPASLTLVEGTTGNPHAAGAAENHHRVGRSL